MNRTAHPARPGPAALDVPRTVVRELGGARDDCPGGPVGLHRAGATAAQEAGSEQVAVLGHSLGGVVLRCAVARLGLAPHLVTAVTVAAPHRGTRAAFLGPGNVTASLRPGSALLEDLRGRTWNSGLPWVAYHGDRDLVVPPGPARLEGDGPGACDVLVARAGHLGVLRAPAFLDSVVGLLLDRDLATSGGIDRPPSDEQPADDRAA